MATTKPAAKKRGSPGDFIGKRNDFLRAWIPEYTEASKKKSFDGLWDRIFNQYWSNFHWSVPLPQEIDGDIHIDTSKTWVMPQEVKETLTEAEIAARATTKDEVQKKIKAWFNHRRGHMGLAGHPWKKFLKSLRTPDTPPPKRLSDQQYYMTQKAYADKVTKKFKEDHPNAHRDQRLALRCDVAKELLEAEPQDVQDRIHAEAEKKHADALQAYQAAVAGAPPMTEEERELARARLTEMMTPLLSAIAEFTNYELVLLAGRAVTEPQPDVLVKVISAKTPGATGKVFADWDTIRYKLFAETFSRFVWETRESAPTDAEGSEPAPTDADKGDAAQTEQEGHPVPPPSNPVTPQTLESSQRPSTPPPASPPASNVVVATDFESPVRRKLAAMPPNEREAYEAALKGMSSLELSNATAEATEKERQLEAQEGQGKDSDAPQQDPFEGMQIFSPLRRRTFALAEKSGDLELEIDKLRWLSAYEIERENNVARNYELLDKLKVGNVSSILGVKRGRKPAQGGNRKRGRKDGGKGGRHSDDGDEGDDEDEEDDEEGETEGEHDKVNVPPAERPKRSLPAKRASTGQEWFDKAVKQLAEGNVYGPVWEEVVGLWRSREEAKGFISPTKGFSAKHRPQQIGAWIQRARTGKPVIKNVEAFAEQWGLWWYDINPPSRKTKNPLELTKTSGPLAALDVPGVNGFLSILISLLWWRKMLEVESREWRIAVQDVKWVLQQLSGPVASTSSARAPASSSSSTPSSSSFSSSTPSSSSDPSLSSTPAPGPPSTPSVSSTSTGSTAPPSPAQPSTTSALPAAISGDASMLTVSATDDGGIVSPPDSHAPVPDLNGPAPMSDGPPSGNAAASYQRPRARPNWRNASSSSTPANNAGIPATASIIMEPVAPSSGPPAEMEVGDSDRDAQREALLARGFTAEEADEVMGDPEADEDMEKEDLMDEDA
ncbi:hypothetical protein R3P38DRAFT_3206497 [Favolaschia claudopus]|uniref:Uncharacterized protein n=1 Tax=Favolaschia claudopus TaxID=2862362 RepID=A0AAW0AMI9_9AGAR